MVQLLSTMASTQTSQNELLNRVVTELESKIAEQERLIGELQEILGNQNEQVAQLQTAMNALIPADEYRRSMASNLL